MYTVEILTVRQQWNSYLKSAWPIYAIGYFIFAKRPTFKKFNFSDLDYFQFLIKTFILQISEIAF